MDGFAIYVRRHLKNNDSPLDLAMFTKVLPTNQRTDRQTDQPTDIPSYRDAIATSKNQLLGIEHSSEKVAQVSGFLTDK